MHHSCVLNCISSEGLTCRAHFHCLPCPTDPTLIELAANRSKVGKWTMLVDQLFSIRDFAPVECQPAYLITEVLFLTMLQVSTPHSLGSLASFSSCLCTKLCDVNRVA